MRVTYTVGSLKGILQTEHKHTIARAHAIASARPPPSRPGGRFVRFLRTNYGAACAPVIDKVAKLLNNNLGEASESADHERARPPVPKKQGNLRMRGEQYHRRCVEEKKLFAKLRAAAGCTGAQAQAR